MTKDPLGASIKIEVARSQSLLLDFLRADLDLGSTYLSLATAGMNAKPGRAMELVSKACKVVEAVRQFEGRITDAVQCNEVHERANQLEAAIARLMNERPK